MQGFAGLYQQRQHVRSVKQRRVVAAKFFFIHQQLGQLAEQHAAQNIINLTVFQPATHAFSVKQGLKMIIQPHRIGPRLLYQSFNHQLNGTHLFLRLKLALLLWHPPGFVGQEGLLQTQIFKGGDEAHRRNQLIFADILPAFILGNTLLKQA